MERIHKEKALESVPFTIPDSVVSAKICTKSGKLAVEGLCDEYIGGSTVVTEYFAKGTVPTEKCDVHYKVNICKDSGKITNEYCPATSYESKVYLVKDEKNKTFDTPYVLPKDTCDVHSAGTTLPLPDSIIPSDANYNDIYDNLNQGDDINNSETESTDETTGETISESIPAEINVGNNGNNNKSNGKSKNN